MSGPGGGSKVQALVQVAAGLALNVYPAMFIAVYARIAPIEAQGYLAVSLTVGVYVAQLFNAYVVEGRLATPGANHDLRLPWWTAILTAVAGSMLILGPVVATTPVLMASSVGIMTGLLMSRSIGVVRGTWMTEALGAAVLIGAGVAALALAAAHNGRSVAVLALGGVAAVLVRFWPRAPKRDGGAPTDVRNASWVTAETAVVGVVQPAITYIVLLTLGPAASVAFRVISTVSGALEPILAYGRYRLLAHGHKGELGTFAAIFGIGMAAVLAGAFGGLGLLVFGPAWGLVGAFALLVACGWKVAMLFTTVPFAALRKAGLTATVFWIRVATTVAYLVLSIGALLLWQSVTALFAAFVLAEIFAAVLYHRVAQRRVPDYDLTLATMSGAVGAGVVARLRNAGNRRPPC